MAYRNNSDRLHALHSYTLLGAQSASSQWQRVVALAARTLNMSTAIATLVDATQVHIQVNEGPLDATLYRQHGFCAEVVNSQQALVVNDLRQDDRFADHPLVSGETALQSYAGIPLTTPSEHVIGTLAVMDGRPHTFTDNDRQTLRDLAALGQAQQHPAPAATSPQDILESITDAFFALDSQWQFTYVNKQAETVLQRTRHELIGANVWDEFPEAVDLAFYEEYHRAVRTQESTQFEAYFPPLNTWFRVNAYPFEGGLSVYFDDITEHRRLQAQLRDEKRQAQMLFADNPVPMFVYSPDTLRFLDANEAAIRQYGYTRHELLDMEITDIRPAHEADQLRNYLQQDRPHLRTPPGTWTHLHADGTAIHVEATSSEITYEGAPAVLVAVNDVTEQHEAQQALRKREALLRSINNHITEGIYRATPEEGLVYVNDAFVDIFGYPSREDLLRLESLDALYATPEQRDVLVQESHETGHIQNREVEFRRTDGTTFWGLLSATAVRDENGAILHRDGAVLDISTRKEAERELKAHEEYLAVTLNSIGDGVIATDPQGHITEMNQVAQDLTGWPIAEAEGRLLTEVFPIHNVHTKAPVENPVDKVLREDGIVGMANHTVLTDRTGATIHIADSAAPIRDDDDQLLGVVLVFRDVTDEYEQQAALEAERKRLELALRGGDLGLWDWNLKTGEVYYNDRWGEMLGYEPHEIENTVDMFEKAAHPEDKERTFQEIERHLNGEIPHVDLEIRMYTKQGDVRWILDRGQIVERDEDGTPLRVAGTHLDITERKQATEELARQKRLLDSAIDSLPGIFYLVEEEGPILRWNDNLEHVIEYSAEEIDTLAPLEDLFEGDDQARVRYAVRTAFQEGHATVQATIVSKSGERTPYFFSGRSIVIEDTPCIIGVGVDITERKKAEAALQARERRLETFYDAMSRLAQAETPEVLAQQVCDLITDTLEYPICAMRYVQNGELVPVAVSDACTKLMEGERPAYDLDGPGGVVKAYRTQSTVRYRESNGSEAIHILEQGNVQSSVYVPIRRYGTISVASTDPEGIDPFDVNLLDILAHNMASVLDRIARERELRDARDEAKEMNRLKSAFLANMSHEIRTPLTSIIGFSEILADEADDSTQHFAELIQNSSQRLMETLRSVLDLSKLEAGAMELEPHQIRIDRVVQETVDLFQARAESDGITLAVHGIDQPVNASVDRGALHRILSNVLSNAIKFTPADGQVTLRLRTTPDVLTLDIEDTGVGIDEDFLPHLFDAFRQESTGDTRAYEGSGLGLTITKRLVEMMNGTIEVQSTKGEGTTFTVRLPRNVPESLSEDDSE